MTPNSVYALTRPSRVDLLAQVHHSWLRARIDAIRGEWRVLFRV